MLHRLLLDLVRASEGEIGNGGVGGWADLLMPAGSLTEVSGQQRLSNARLVGLKRQQKKVRNASVATLERTERSVT